jgi:hypothetical protein
MKKELFNKEKTILPLHYEIQNHHAHLLNQHFKDIDLYTEDEQLSIFTAFPTPNDYYKEHLNDLIKAKKDHVTNEK